jgi:DNA-binding XRE family transcriptional regulator
MTTNYKIHSLKESSSNTNSWAFVSYKNTEVTLRSELPGTSPSAVLVRLIEVQKDTVQIERRSSRNGRLSVSQELRQRETTELAFKNRMQIARRDLAGNFLTGESASFKRLRLLKGFSQSSLASATGTSQAHVSKIENGEIQPTEQTLRKMADAMAADIGVLRTLVKPYATGSGGGL